MANRNFKGKSLNADIEGEAVFAVRSNGDCVPLSEIVRMRTELARLLSDEGTDYLNDYIAGDDAARIPNTPCLMVFEGRLGIDEMNGSEWLDGKFRRANYYDLVRHNLINPLGLPKK